MGHSVPRDSCNTPCPISSSSPVSALIWEQVFSRNQSAQLLHPAICITAASIKPVNLPSRNCFMASRDVVHIALFPSGTVPFLRRFILAGLTGKSSPASRGITRNYTRNHADPASWRIQRSSAFSQMFSVVQRYRTQ